MVEWKENRGFVILDWDFVWSVDPSFFCALFAVKPDTKWLGIFHKRVMLAQNHLIWLRGIMLCGSMLYSSMLYTE
jgi:hypothetical protein